MFIQIKDNNTGKELSTSTISRWNCGTIVKSHATLEKSKSLPKKVKAQVRASPLTTTVHQGGSADGLGQADGLVEAPSLLRT